MSRLKGNCVLHYIAFVLSAVLTDITETENNILPIVELHRCPGTNLPPEITVPSFPFATNISIRFPNENFPGCAEGVSIEEANYFFLPESNNFSLNFSNMSLDEIDEMKYFESQVTITPDGILSMDPYFYSPHEYCIQSYSETTVEIAQQMTIKYCPFDCTTENNGKNNILCVKKCCTVGKSLAHDEFGFWCESSNNNHWKPKFYSEKNWNENMEDTFMQPRFHRPNTSYSTCESHIWSNNFNNKHFFYQPTRLLANGTLIYLDVTRRWKLFNDDNYCIDRFLDDSEKSNAINATNIPETVHHFTSVCFSSAVNETGYTFDHKIVTLVAHVITAVFYLATSTVYIILWEKQKTYGWTLFSLCLSQAFTNIFLGNTLILSFDLDTQFSTQCIANGVLAHFFFLASIFWLSMINFEVWLTFRSISPSRGASHRFKNLFYYSIIAWGVPFIVVIVGFILDIEYENRESMVLVPAYGENCFVSWWSFDQYVVYVAIPPLSLAVLLCVATFWNLCRFHKQTSCARNSTAARQQVFYLYAKLSTVLGISWILWFISMSWGLFSVEVQFYIGLFCDIYNIFSSVVICFLFACNNKVYTQITQKYSFVKRCRFCFCRKPKNLNLAAVTQPQHPSQLKKKTSLTNSLSFNRKFSLTSTTSLV